MNSKMDEGDILKIAKVDIDKDDRTPDIFQKFSDIGPGLVIQTLREIGS
jgi:methionyl-tRNA formyltransferase